MADSISSTGDPDVDAAFGGRQTEAAPLPAVMTGDPDVDRALPQLSVAAEKKSAPPIKYDAALFRQRVGRNPEPAELANFTASKGVGWTGDPGANVLSPVGVVVDRTLGGAARGVAGGYRGLRTVLSGEGAEQAAKNVETITSQEGEGSPRTAAALASPYNPLNYVDESGQFLGDKASDLGAPPIVSTALRIAPDVAASVLGLRGMRGRASVSTMSEPETVANAPHPLQGAVDTAADRFSAMRQQGIQAGLKLTDRPPNPQVVASNGMIQDELDLPRQTSSGNPAPITKRVLQAARDRVAGPAYDTVREVPEFNVSDEYEGALKGIDMGKLPEEMRPPGINSTMSGEQAVELSRELRARASKLYAAAKQGHPELEDIAEAHRAAAEVVEDEVSRHLSPQAVSHWDTARTYVAKTYNVEGALDGAGNVIVPKLKAQMLKNKPLTGNIETLATLGAMDPTAFAARPMAPPPAGLIRRGAATVIPPLATLGGSLLGGAVGHPTTGAMLGEGAGVRIANRVLNP